MRSLCNMLATERNLHTTCLDWTNQSPTLADFFNGELWRKHTILIRWMYWQGSDNQFMYRSLYFKRKSIPERTFEKQNIMEYPGNAFFLIRDDSICKNNFQDWELTFTRSTFSDVTENRPFICTTLALDLSSNESPYPIRIGKLSFSVALFHLNVLHPIE